MIKLLSLLFLSVVFMFFGFWFWYFIGGIKHWSAIPTVIVCFFGCLIHLALSLLAFKELISKELKKGQES